MRVYMSEQMRRIDALASEKFNIPSIVLMENAAIACVREISEYDRFMILCGKGNNGGDGMACARHLINMGKSVRVYLMLGEDFSGDAYINYSILKSMGVVFSHLESITEFEKDLRDSDCVVDAIFGTGMRGCVGESIKAAIEAIDRSSAYVLSVDVPSGINGDSGEIANVCVRADKTVTFAAYKTGLLMYPAADAAGEIVCADISVPEAVFKEVAETAQILEPDYIRNIMPKRYANSHKGNYGKILIIGGSRGMAGAVVMAADAAFKAGAGLVTVCVPDEINDIVQTALPQAMTFPANFDKDCDEIAKMSENYDVVLFGNGIGRDKPAEKLLKAVAERARKTLVIDADGITLLSKKLQLLKNSDAKIILTPHSMEMARLCNTTPEEVEKNRLNVSKEFVSEYELTLVLKGNHSIITAPDRVQKINLTGNSALATAGSGDVLAGLTAGFAASGIEAYKACELAVFLHGKAGEYAGKRLTEYAVTAPDVIKAVPHILPVENSFNL